MALAASAPTVVTEAGRRSSDTGQAYAELKRTIVAAGLLERNYRYYLVRGAPLSSFLA